MVSSESSGSIFTKKMIRDIGDMFETLSKALNIVDQRISALEENYRDFNKEIKKVSKEKEMSERISKQEQAIWKRDRLIEELGAKVERLEERLDESNIPHEMESQ
jgi:DNA repair ATPase RecN|tara:strand:+ start:32 stop:346 length:315 start_codon:yes stop_codon:yes gene_type:complete